MSPYRPVVGYEEVWVVVAVTPVSPAVRRIFQSYLGPGVVGGEEDCGGTCDEAVSGVEFALSGRGEVW